MGFWLGRTARDQRHDSYSARGGVDFTDSAFCAGATCGLKLPNKERSMKRNLLLVVSCMALLMSIAAWGQMLGKGHSEADAVKNALKQADLQDVTVSDDADKNTITLAGTVHSEEARAKAAQVAKSAAGNRQIANEVSVQLVGDVSSAISIASDLVDGIA